MGIIAFAFSFLIGLIVRMIIKLRLGVALIYIVLMATVFSDWVNKTELNETIAICGFAIIIFYCLANTIYSFFHSIKNAYKENHHLS